MLDIFNNYELQREELLARIAHELELDQTRKERMEQAYGNVLEVLKKDEVFFEGAGRTRTERSREGRWRIGMAVPGLRQLAWAWHTSSARLFHTSIGLQWCPPPAQAPSLVMHLALVLRRVWLEGAACLRPTRAQHKATDMAVLSWGLRYHDVELVGSGQHHRN